MVPLWSLPFAITAGNTFIIKPSEKDPGASMLLAKWLNEVNLPKGVVNIVHGGFETVKMICQKNNI